MKRKLVLGIAILLVAAVIGWIFAHQTTARHVSSIEAEIKLLEATLEEAAEKFDAGTIKTHEVQSYNDRIGTHLDRVDYHPWSASIVGYSDFHLDIFADLIDTLEDFKDEHNDMLVAFNTNPFDANVDIDIDPSQPPPFPDTPDLPVGPTTVTVTDAQTDVFDDTLLTFNDAWLYCPGTNPECWDPGTFFD